jgi:CRISPR-associated protein Csb3
LENKFLVLDWWLDPYHAQAKEFTLLWPGRATSQTIAAKLLAGMKEFSESPTDLINSAAYLESRFGIDTRSSWNALDVGFSPHAQDLPVRTYPFAEMLAAFGLQGFRPRELPNRTYEYVLWRQLLPSIVARTASAYSWSGLDSQTHRFQLVERTGRTVQPTLSQVVAQTRRT